MNFFIVCLAITLSGVFAIPGDPAAVAKWETFKILHGKQHVAEEEPSRFQKFLERDAEIEAHNARYAAGNESFSLQHGQYSDLDSEEFAAVALGFVPAIPDNEIPYSEEPILPSIPESFDWRNEGIMTPVTNQKYCGSCYAFAGTAALEAYLKWKRGKTYDLSEQDIVDCSYKKMMRRRHNLGCQGGWPTAVYDYFNIKDLVPEDKYPYTSGDTGRHGRCQIRRPIDNQVRRKLKVKNVRVGSEDEMASLLVSKGPLVIAMAADHAYKRYFDNLGDGVFDMDHAIGLTPNHAVVLVGYGHQDGKDYWVIKNSWGDKWASGGYGKIRRGRNMCNLMRFGVFFVEE